MNRTVIIILFIFLVAGADDNPYRDAGAAAYAFLKIDTGARGASLGGTGILNGGAMALFWNPALLAEMDCSGFSAEHNEWFGSARLECIAWNFSVGKVRTAIGTKVLHIGDLEYRQEATSEPVDIFSAYDFSFNAAAALSLADFDIGIGVKIIREKIWLEESSGIAFDVGVIYHPWNFLDVTAVFQHLGPEVTMVNKPYRMPRIWRAAARLHSFIPFLSGRTSFTAEVSKAIDSPPAYGIGIEYEPNKWLVLRTGSKLENDSHTFTYGTGFNAGRWSLDYAVIPGNYGLGLSHRFNISRTI